MSARDAILAAVRRNQTVGAATAPAPTPPPDLSALATAASRLGGGVEDLLARFTAAVEAAGGAVVEAERGGVEAAVRAAYPEAERVASRADSVPGTAPLDGAPHALADLDLFVCASACGVAENGAVWLPESAVGSRVAPFLASHVAVVVARSALVPTMHDAYARIEGGAEGFGVFVAGPSKTADIEQSLVVGAHGPVSLTVVLVG